MSGRRTICVVTGSRAEYGLLRWVLRAIEKAEDLELQLVVTGMLLSPYFGLTYRQIEADGFSITRKVEMPLSCDSGAGIAKSTGLGLIGFADAFESLRPDVVVMLGDRFELLSAASAALFATLPIAHIHGGETTLVSMDEIMRHVITKMSHIHFVAAEDYRKRVIQLGEQPKSVFMTGGLGAEIINNVELLNKKELEDKFNFKFGKKNLMVTFHPITLSNKKNKDFINQILLALKDLKDTKIFFTFPNIDPENKFIQKSILSFKKKENNRVCVFKSLGIKNYLSFLKYVDGAVGNSSSGISEAPSFKIGTVNIGDRQKGRVLANSIINCKANKKDIIKSIKMIYQTKFKLKIKKQKNPYYFGSSSNKILNKLKKINLNSFKRKKFFNIQGMI